MAPAAVVGTALPLEELLQPTLAYLELRSIPQVASACRSWAAACRDERLWWALLQQYWSIDHLQGVRPRSSSPREVLREAIAMAWRSSNSRLEDLMPFDDLAMAVVWDDLGPHVRAFLFGIANGFMPTHDGLFTFHCRAATPIHYRHSGLPDGDRVGGGRQVIGGYWEWSPDREEWFPTTTEEITRGRFRGGMWRLVYQNQTIVRFLQQWPLVPFFLKAVQCLPPAMMLASRFNLAALMEFGRHVEFDMSPTPSHPGPTTPCVRLDVFTVHWLFGPPLQLACRETGWQISGSPQEQGTSTQEFLKEDLPAWTEFVKLLNQQHFPEWSRGTPMAARFYMYCQEVLSRLLT